MEKGVEMEQFSNQNQIEIEQGESENQALEALASDLLDKINEANKASSERFTVLMPAGSAAEKFFVIFKNRLSEVDFSKVHFIQAEQLWPIPKDHPASLLGGMEKKLLEAGVVKENIHLFDSEALSEKDATKEVEENLEYGVDYAIVGLNASGAIAGLRDGEEFKEKHLDMVDIDIKTPELYPREDLGMEDLPYKSLRELIKTMYEKYWPNSEDQRPSRMFGPGWNYLLKAKELAILATGSSKKEAINFALSNIGVDIPVRNNKGVIDVVISQPRDINNHARHLTSTGEIALSRKSKELGTKIYTDYSLK